MRRLALPFVLFPGLFPLALAGCTQGYSPNTYASNAAQEEAAVQRGVIIGVRQVLISSSGTVGAAAGGAAGGVAGAQVAGGPTATAFGAIGGALVGGVGGTAAEQALADTKGWEYIVQETGDKLVSVTQTSKTALPIGQAVLVISDAQQARIVPDYTVQVPAGPPSANAAAAGAAKNSAATGGSATNQIQVNLGLPFAGAVQPVPAAADAGASDSTASPAASPAPAGPASSTPAASFPSGAAAAQKPANSAGAATITPSASTAKPAQAAPEAPASTMPASSSAAATP